MKHHSKIEEKCKDKKNKKKRKRRKNVFVTLVKNICFLVLIRNANCKYILICDFYLLRKVEICVSLPVIFGLL